MLGGDYFDEVAGWFAVNVGLAIVDGIRGTGDRVVGIGIVVDVGWSAVVVSFLGDRLVRNRHANFV